MNKSNLKTNPVIINSRKYNAVIHRCWQAFLIGRENSLLSFLGEFDREVKHEHLGVIRRGTISYEFYWLDRYYNVFRFHEPEGEFRNFYCNINLPPVFENGVLDYIDLEIDVIVYKDFSYKILDEEEFLENSKLYNYSDELILKTRKTLQEILSLIKIREFPFDFDTEKH
jgi:protein associated with RNAse G/E